MVLMIRRTAAEDGSPPVIPDVAPVPTSQGPSREMVKEMGTQTLLCLTAYLQNRPAELAQESAVFLEYLARFWAQDQISETQVWQELGARLTLSHELLARGIRARKGEGYRSTKLP